MQIPSMSGGEGPVFLDNLDCTSSDDDLLSCHTLFTSLGLSNCTHTQDVSVRCTGIILKYLGKMYTYYCTTSVVQILMSVQLTATIVTNAVKTQLVAFFAAV